MVVSINNSIVLNTACFCPPTNRSPFPESACIGSQLTVTVYYSAVHCYIISKHGINTIISVVVHAIGKPVKLTGVFNGIIAVILGKKFRVMAFAHIFCRLIVVANGTESIIIAM